MPVDLRRDIGFDSVPPGQRHPVVSNRFWAIMDAAGLKRFRRGDASPDFSHAVVVGLAPSYSVYDIRFAECLLDSSSKGICANLYLFDVLDVRDMEDIEVFLPGFGKAYQSPMVGIWENGALLQKGEGFPGMRLVESALGMKCEDRGPRPWS